MQTFSPFPASCPLRLSPHLVAQSGKRQQVQMAPVSSYNLSHHITAHESSIDHSEIKDPCFIQSQTPLIPNFASVTSLISYRHSQHAALYVGIVVITHRHKCYFLLCFVSFRFHFCSTSPLQLMPVPPFQGWAQLTLKSSLQEAAAVKKAKHDLLTCTNIFT